MHAYVTYSYVAFNFYFTEDLCSEPLVIPMKTGLKRKASSRSCRKLSAEEFYESVKRSCAFKLSLKSTDEPEKIKKDEIIDQTKKLAFSIICENRKNVKYCISIGRNLVTLKTKFKFTDERLNETFQQVKGMAKSSRIFYIAIYKLSLDYPNVEFITIPYSDLSQNLNSFRKSVTEEKTDFWKKPLA